MRSLTVLLVAAAAAVRVQSALAEPAHTTRIETQQYYGAVVTVEHGVRVIRPLPPTEHLIVNPGGKTPLVLSIGKKPVNNQSPWSTPSR
jgi:hypothetical protein